MAAASIQRTLAALAVDCVSVRTDIDCDRRKSLQDSWNGLLHQPGRGTTSEHRGQPAPAGRNRELAFERIRSTGRRSIPRNQTDLSRRDRRSSLQQPGASGAPRGRARPRTGTAPIVGAPPNERYPCGLHRWRGIIYLIEGWTGRTPADLSVLVHEMVHHFQYKLGLKHECPQDREKLAYAAQDRWLHLFGHSLESDFELDGFSVIVKTHACTDCASARAHRNSPTRAA